MSVTIPEGVTNIGLQAFDNCSGLTSLQTILVEADDAQRVKTLLSASGFDVAGVSFIEDEPPEEIFETFHKGYTFAGWARTKTATSAEFTNGKRVQDLAASGKTLVLYAVWKKNNP